MNSIIKSLPLSQSALLNLSIKINFKIRSQAEKYVPAFDRAIGKLDTRLHLCNFGSYFSTVDNSVLPLEPPTAYTFPKTTAMLNLPRASFNGAKAAQRLVFGS